MSCASTSNSYRPTIAEQIKYMELRSKGLNPAQIIHAEISTDSAIFHEGIKQITSDLFTKQKEKEDELNDLVTKLKALTLDPERKHIQNLTQVAKKQHEIAQGLLETDGTIDMLLKKEKEDKMTLGEDLKELKQVAKKAPTLQNPFNR